MRQHSIDRELTMELMVGTFMFMILLALGYFTIVLGRASFFEKKYPFEVEFDEVMGLRKDDNVVLHGMTVGKIKTLHLTNQRVRVEASLDDPVQLKKDYKIVIVSTSILGGRYVEIREGSKGAPYLPPSVMPQGDRPFDLMGEAAAMIHELRGALDEGGILTNLEVAASSIREISDKIRRGEGSIGKLMTDDSVYNDLQAMMKDARELASKLKDVADKVNRGEGTLGKLLADDTVYKDIQSVTSNLKTLSDRLASGEGTLGKLMSKDDTVYKDIAATAASLKNVTERIDRGEGLLGKITKDDSLYQDIKQAVSEVRAAVDDFRETSPVVTFSSLLFGAF